MRQDRVSLFEGYTRRLEVAGVEERLSFVPAHLGLLHFLGRRRRLRDCAGTCEDEAHEQAEKALRPHAIRNEHSRDARSRWKETFS